jgi:PKHD-type hydroxylase
LIKYDFAAYPSVISPDLCNQIVAVGERAMDASDDIQATTFAGKPSVANTAPAIDIDAIPAEERANYHVRNTHVSWLEDKWIYELIVPYMKAGNELLEMNFAFNEFEPMQFTRYRDSQFYGWHMDGAAKNGEGKVFVDQAGNRIERKFTCVLMLNDPSEYEGGDLILDLGGRGSEETRLSEPSTYNMKGTVIVFPSYMWHMVNAVTSGTRYTLVLWAVGPPFR